MTNYTMTTQPKQKPLRSIATHLDIVIDRNKPPPQMSKAFSAIHKQVTRTWTLFEAAEAHLVTVDDTVHQELLDWISRHQRALPQQVLAEKNRLTLQLCEPRIKEAEKQCMNLARGIQVLKDAAAREPQTMESRAFWRIDVGVMQRCLRTTREIVETARLNVEQARSSQK